MIVFAFLFLVVVGVGLYLLNSGVLTSGITYLKSSFPSNGLGIQFGGPTTSTISNASSAGEGAGAGASAPQAAPSSAPSSTSPTSSNPNNPNLVNPQIPAGFTASELSPYYEEITFGGLNPGPVPALGETGYGQITLYANYPDASTTINVTGWEIKTNRSGEYIPKAVEFYDPLGIDPPTDIIMKNGDELDIYSSSAPVNLRLNECIGYLPNRSQFNPELPQTCPGINDPTISQFSGACQNYINSLGGCQSPDMSSPNIPPYDYACKDYLQNKFNYKWCYDTYFSDPNFLSNQIEVWTGSSPLDQYHDNVELLDSNGLLVDYTSY